MWGFYNEGVFFVFFLFFFFLGGGFCKGYPYFRNYSYRPSLRGCPRHTLSSCNVMLSVCPKLGTLLQLYHFINLGFLEFHIQGATS